MNNKTQKKNKLIFFVGLAVVVIALVLFLLLRGGKTYTLKGKLKGGENKYLVLLDISGENPKTVDTIYLSSNGKFSKKEIFTEPSLLILQADKDFIMLCPSKKEKIKINGEFNNFSSTYQIKGSKESEKLHLLAERQIAIGNLLKEIQTQYDNASEDQKPMLIKEFRLRFKKIAQEEYVFLKKFISENIGSLVTLPALYSEVVDQPLFNPYEDEKVYKQVLQGLEKTLPNNPNTIKFRKFMEDFEQSKKTIPAQ